MHYYGLTRPVKELCLIERRERQEQREANASARDVISPQYIRHAIIIHTSAGVLEITLRSFHIASRYIQW